MIFLSQSSQSSTRFHQIQILDSRMSSSRLSSPMFFFFIVSFINLVFTAEGDLTTQSSTSGDDNHSVSDAPTSSTASPKNDSTTVSPSSVKANTTVKNKNIPKKKEIESVVPEPPTIQVPLAGESLKLNITVLEKVVEFSLTLNSNSKIGGISVSDSRRLLLALENEHFNVDVISVPLLTGGKSFGKKVEDWGWNKRNGVLLQDNTKNYKWIMSGSGNDSTIFVTFQRNWQTCDVQDIHFGLSPIKIWWLLDTEDKRAPAKHEIAKMVHTSEKQKAAISTPGESNTTPKPSLDDKSSTMKKDGMSLNTTMATIEEVEVLKSIQESNFQGPVNFTFASLLKNVTDFFIKVKGCGGPSTQFHCNSSDILQLQSANRSDFLSVAKIFLQNAEFLKPAVGSMQPCKIAIDYTKSGNEKQFHALFGFPNKNQGTSITPSNIYWITYGYLLMKIMIHSFWASFSRRITKI